MTWLKDPKTYIIIALAALSAYLWLRSEPAPARET